MFKPLGLFSAIQCPDKLQCTRSPCPFSHKDPLADQPRPSPSPVASPSAPARERKVQRKASPIPAPVTAKVVPAKRHSDSLGNEDAQPPRKLKAVAPPASSFVVTPRRPLAVPVPVAGSSTGPPVLAINAAHSKIPMKDRQTMVSRLWEAFAGLYSSIVPSPGPDLAREHALKQEADVYDKTNKFTYRNAVITALASMKRRPPPTTQSHPSVGTESELTQRQREQESLAALVITVSDLESAVLSKEAMPVWEYVVEVPEGPGGNMPSDDGVERTCERCKMPFLVQGDAVDRTACKFHWARPRTQKVPGGKREKFFACCSSTDSAEGCQLGAHVFRETDAKDLHARHAFTPTLPLAPGAQTLDVVALDCEMVYSTQGMSCARVTVVDVRGDKVLDELLRLDEGVKVLDYNTRFSGITDLSSAVLDLEGVRSALSHFIGPDTIIIGHALENDLKTMRMIHHRVVDSAILFPHHAGPPIRHALRELVKVHLGQLIQTAGAAGHSSLEDAKGALNLVKFWVKREREKIKAGFGVAPGANTPSKLNGAKDDSSKPGTDGRGIAGKS